MTTVSPRAVAFSYSCCPRSSLLHVAHLAVLEGDFHAVVVINDLRSQVRYSCRRTQSRLHLIGGLAQLNGCGPGRRSGSSGSRATWHCLGICVLFGLVSLLPLLLNVGCV